MAGNITNCLTSTSKKAMLKVNTSGACIRQVRGMAPTGPEPNISGAGDNFHNVYQFYKIAAMNTT